MISWRSVEGHALVRQVHGCIQRIIAVAAGQSRPKGNGMPLGVGVESDRHESYCVWVDWTGRTRARNVLASPKVQQFIKDAQHLFREAK